MPIVIDGSNLGGALGGRRGSRDAAAVLELLLPWARQRGGPVVLVFDGEPRDGVADRYGALAVRWGAGRSADEVILRLVAKNPVDWWVVTNDRELARRCRDAGARRLAVAELLVRTPAHRERRHGAGCAGERVDVEDWERWFRGEVE